MKGLSKIPNDSMMGCQPMNAMVDIAFLLLIFFLVATTLQPRERDLPLEMPVVGQSVGDPSLPTVIHVLADGGVMWGEGAAALLLEPADSGRGLPALAENLSGMVSALGADGVCVVLRADEDAKQQRVIDVLDTLAAAGIDHIALSDPH
ncbi:MAG: biopolymer transporter ExbD [Akkermansiaceae bacterium]|jgi:biopolymer transport protein ExbD|nr:biopolymer transporter ExbD [Akkermansiaceae bacterium]